MKHYFYFFIIALISSCTSTNQQELRIITGNAIGTTYSIRYLDHSTKSYEKEIDELIRDINKSTSTYIPTSDISKINKGDSDIVVDGYFTEVFEKSKRIYKETNGEFDPTIGVLVNAWGFGPGKDIEQMNSDTISNLMQYVGMDKIALKNGKIIKTYPEVYLDFNAIGKGYLVDVIGRMFEKNGIENYMVEIGGEIRTRGVNQKGIHWRIAIENPNFDGSRSYATTVQLVDESMATSGNYRKFRTDEEGRKFVHTINAKTGYARESNLLSASVISKGDCADVDGYATAFMAMGLEKTINFLKNHPELKSFLIFADENGALETYQTPNFNN